MIESEIEGGLPVSPEGKIMCRWNGQASDGEENDENC